MDLKLIRQILRLVESSQVAEVEIEEGGFRIAVRKQSAPEPLNGPPQVWWMPPSAPASAPPAPAAQPVAPEKPPPQAEAPAPEAEAGKKLHEIRSPIVGTFYRAPAPDKPPFVQVGDVVSAGQTLCIIEAMKIMNEIPSDISGRIVKILVENAQPVEYDQLLFLLEPT
ncbi:MAG: acetyl-CoA carboxylase biotin carboxyl carrier protein [Bacteroidetes bacterium]|nr:acetyl-CoA carboxylase biotin carboxyl carrier protein [Rhodothermia bacterium]MCS7154839.1 acetyl-CoA carboxylase biotin carboxyl carrier protein [Bacteroidota bacterium]MCX7907003.1 acetyl-CoA carboxylase biotin carboxyl carrier protein [Bacteroidota bacterium]MDW8137633.1 acetyl-CoA carboxylase biotin carboxyl carrier protein [Bacteroidota bacterium]MDW8285413.1 acetyl-CoA carboxylase biotin carboxyl carrier protein [Bacteroidota bacterium]